MLEGCEDSMEAACPAGIVIKSASLMLGFLSNHIYLVEHLQRQLHVEVGKSSLLACGKHRRVSGLRHMSSISKLSDQLAPP